MGRRGVLEEQTTRVASLVESSAKLTHAGIYHTTIIYHPNEGLIVTGEEEMAAKVLEVIEGSGLREVVNDAQIRAGNMLNHFSSRKIKQDLLSKLYRCNLPALPMPLSEMRTVVLLTKAFGKVLETELKGLKYKLGQGPMPEKVKDWFNYGEQIWACFTGTTQHAPELADHLKARRLTMAAFLRDLLKKVYNVRIRGGDVEDFHLERDYEELRWMMTRRERGEGAEDEQGEVGLNKV